MRSEWRELESVVCGGIWCVHADIGRVYCKYVYVCTLDNNSSMQSIQKTTPYTRSWMAKWCLKSTTLKFWGVKLTEVGHHQETNKKFWDHWTSERKGKRSKTFKEMRCLKIKSKKITFIEHLFWTRHGNVLYPWSHSISTLYLWMSCYYPFYKWGLWSVLVS